MRAVVERDERGLSILIEYLALIAVVSVFVLILGMHLKNVFEESQLSVVLENQFADVASQVSALYTDYVLISPESGRITTYLSLIPQIGQHQYRVGFNEQAFKVFVSVESPGGYRAASGLGLNTFVIGKSTTTISVEGETQSGKASPESESKPKIAYEGNKTCPFIPKPRLRIYPSPSIDVGTTSYVTIRVYFYNPDEITEHIVWTLTLWNGSTITDSALEKNVTVPISWPPDGCAINGYNATCNLSIFAMIDGNKDCNATYDTSLLVSNEPEKTPPYLFYNKWVEPNVVDLDQEFEMHLLLQGRGFIAKSARNLSVVHVIDISGSMMHVTLSREFSTIISPTVWEKVINVSAGTVEIDAYVTQTLPSWYSNSMCQACPGWGYRCPWYNIGYSDSFVKLYVNDVEQTAQISDPTKYGKYFSDVATTNKSYDVKVVARAPQPVDLHLDVYVNGHLVQSYLYKNYTNYQDIYFELPAKVSYVYFMLDDLINLPAWRYSWWYSYQYAESYTVDPKYGCTGWRYWKYWWMCGGVNFVDNLFHVWVVDPNGNKDFLVTSEYRGYWYYAYTYYYPSYQLDLFKSHPAPGTYTLRVSLLDKDPQPFYGKLYLKRMDAAKLASKLFNDMLGANDYVGLVTFTTSAERIAVGSPPLLYMTTNKTEVNNLIDDLVATCATDPAEGLYEAMKTFPIWNEPGNNCTSCIANTRPLVILLTDGRPTTCNDYYPDVDCPCNGDPQAQAECMAKVLKSTYVGSYNISLCTIGFGPDVDEAAQQFLKNIASPMPGGGGKCYFFVTATDELIDAYKAIFNAFSTAAKDVVVHDVLNTTLITPLEYAGKARAISSFYGDISNQLVVKSVPNGTLISLNLSSISKDETIEIIVWLKATSEGYFKVNHPDSYIEYTALDIYGNPRGRVRVPIVSNADYVKVIKGGEPTIGLQ